VRDLKDNNEAKEKMDDSKKKRFMNLWKAPQAILTRFRVSRKLQADCNLIDEDANQADW